jgi:hypothetical protein
MRPRRLPATLARAAVALAVLASAFAFPASSVKAWANGGGDGYGTHDWVIDQAVKVLNGRADDWFNASIARLSSDDPDTIEVPANGAREGEHVYRNQGRRGGAVDRIATEFDLASAAYQQGAAARASGDDGAATTAFNDASYHIGLLSHFLSDIAQPFHSAYAGIGKGQVHANYELRVNSLTNHPGSSPSWASPRRTVSTIGNIRAEAIAEAAYSRKYFATLYGEFRHDQSRLGPKARDITGKVLRRATGDLADVIWSISQGKGAAPAVGSIKLVVKWIGVRSGFSKQVVFVTVKDVNGRPIEGIKVDVAWPTATGIRHDLLYTDATGRQKRVGSVGKSPRLVPLAVTATTTVRGVIKSSNGWWAITPTLHTGGKGFRTVLSDRTVVPGQVVTVRSVAHDTKGRPVPNLLIVWTWNYHGHIVHTRGVTDANGRATSTQLITTATTKATITVTARTQSASRFRTSSTSLKRVN